MPESKNTFGSAIDSILLSLQGFDSDGQRSIIAFVQSHLKLGQKLGQALPQAVGNADPSHALPPISPPVSKDKAERKETDLLVDIKTLRDQKRPSSARQMVCLVAYYVQEHADEHEKKEFITSKDVETYFKQAGFKLPKALEQLLVDCKSAGYFQSINRGEYKLTRVGYNLVAHGLPPKGSEK